MLRDSLEVVIGGCRSEAPVFTVSVACFVLLLRMGTKVQCKSYLPGYYSMKDLNDNSNICSWPLFYGEKSNTNGQYYNGFFPTPASETYLGVEKDAVKLTMLEHEAIFKTQVYELHRLYRIQRDMMEEIKRKEFHSSQIRGDASLSTNLLPSQVASEDVQRLHFTSFPLANSSSNRPSISGAEEINSSLSSMKGNNRQVGPIPSPEKNGLKELERPTKVRRKLLDLQLPADEYIDSEEGEETHDETAPAVYLPYKNGKLGSEKNNDKAGCSFSWKSNGLGDLNDPIKIEETNAPTYADLIVQKSFHSETQACNLSSKPLSRLLGLPTENSLRSGHGSSNAALQNSHNVDRNMNGRGKFSIVLEAGNCKSKLPSSSKPIQGFFTSMEERRGGSEKNHEISFHGGFGASHLTSYHGSPSFNLNKSWEKQQIGNFCQTSESVQTRPNFDFDSSISVHKSSHSLARSNGFFHGSSSGFNDGTVHSSSICYDHPKFSSENSRVPEKKIREASSFFDMNSSDGINLNVRGVHQSGFTIKDVKAQDENHQSTIPWLRAFPLSKKDAVNGDMGFVRSFAPQLYNRSENGDGSKKVLPQLMKFGSGTNEIEDQRSEPGSKKLLGFLIFEESQVAKADTFSATNPDPPSASKVEDGRQRKLLDINLPCDSFVSDTEAVENQSDMGMRHGIDLNLSVSDNEEVFEIDLEAPAVPESTENIVDVEEAEDLGDELMKAAAEAIVSISSKNTIEEEEEEDESRRGMLPWFVDIALNKESTSELSDDFETMTLRLKETAEEDYMPKPLFPDTIKFEESGNFTQTRPRKGQSRRGRQRRDFQRDILPGLTTLSRHEVTEDLQTFGGLMRATGHSWHTGLARRNSGRNSGGGRGRRRVAISPTPLQHTTAPCQVESGLENRSLTGWGKTTRRPRRQRIPASNLHVVPLA